MSRGLVYLETDGPIASISLNRPESLNAISGALADDLTAALREAGSRPDLWVVILRAEGDRAFCVGADLKERASFTLDDFHSNRRQMRAMFAALRSLPQPSIAAVFGHALGGGCELALSCDLVVAAEDTVFGLPEPRVGLLPAGGGTQLLPRLIGLARAKQIVFTGLRINAGEARESGLVADVVTQRDLDARARRLAEEICASSPSSIREAKRSLDAALGVPLEEGIEIENSSWERVVTTEDRAEGVAAFNDKREPRWQNR